MNNLTKQFVEDINKQIVREADSIQRIVYQGYDNDVVVKNINKNIDNINELLAIRTKLLK